MGGVSPYDALPGVGLLLVFTPGSQSFLSKCKLHSKPRGLFLLTSSVWDVFESCQLAKG